MASPEELIARYLARYDSAGVPESDLDAVERRLGLKFPPDMRGIVCACDPSALSLRDSVHFGDVPDDTWGVVGRTLELRSAGLPPNYLALAELEGSIILLDTAAVGTGAAVLWLDNLDVHNLIDCEGLNGPVAVFPSYSAFFEFLLDA